MGVGDSSHWHHQLEIHLEVLYLFRNQHSLLNIVMENKICFTVKIDLDDHCVSYTIYNKASSKLLSASYMYVRSVYC